MTKNISQNLYRKISVFAIIASLLGSFFMTGTVEASSQTPSINIWWPTNNVSVSGVQPLKATLNGWNVDQYNMYWQVDGGKLNYMPSNYEGYPHKEINIDLTNWYWNSNGVYQLNFVAQNLDGSFLSQAPSTIIVNAPKINVAPAPVVPAPVNTSVFNNAKLFVNPYSDSKNWVSANRNSDPANAALMDKIAAQPETQWFGNWNVDIYKDVSNNVTNITNQGALPVMVAYNIPQRDCGSYSAGGSNSSTAYKIWISDFARGIGNRSAVVLLEPDALPGMDCLSSADQQARIGLINYAVQTLKANSKTAVYIDAGNPNWKTPAVMAALLNQAGIAQADGFSLNISNFYSTAQNITYGTELSALVGNKHFVIDTGRNGLGATSDSQWCNPNGRALGSAPTTSTGNNLVDALLWVKGPGGSDGQCNGGPAAGVFWPAYALGLAVRAN
ncbi:MAG: Glucanase [Candidatus Doudnabacteria bacterium]|nr:Glucanase [Candidatus Doudnabacteria bacterium]